jgi:hypothetical protein
VATHSAADAKVVDASAVRVSVVTIPEGAAELGIVQAHVIQGSIEDAIPEFRQQVARLGGDFGKIDDVTTSFEMQSQTSTESYNCGTSDKPRTCTRTVTRQVELATTRIIGKAYRLGAAPDKPPPPEPVAPAESASPASEPDAPQTEPPVDAPAATPNGPEGATPSP